MSRAEEAAAAYRGPVPEEAWTADAEARRRGRVQIFNATRPSGLDGWTMDVRQYDVVRSLVLESIDRHAADDGSVPLQLVVDLAQERLHDHVLFPGARLTNYVRFVKVDLEARDVVQRVPGSSPQRIRLAGSGHR